MKTHSILIAVLLIFFHSHAFGAAPSQGYMRVSYLEGDAQVMPPESGEWGLLSQNAPIGEGDQVWVPINAVAELQLNGGSYIRLDGNTSLQILSMDEDSAQFYLSQGNTYVYYDAPQGSVVQIDTPDSSTRAFDRAIFRVDIADQTTEVACYKGYIETENQAGSTRINAGQRMYIGRDTSGEIAPLGPSDEWEQWNKARNDALFPPQSQSQGYYLPEELSTYSPELNQNGRWVAYAEYGYVWTPTVHVGPGWAPYRHGRWIWRGHDYVWLSYEPWGWAPYHYGRWSYAPSIGWFWVPPAAGAVYWGPGYVGWAGTDDHVAWVPLAPGETYYGRGYYGRNSVNITHIDITRIKITRVYKNTYIDNGATIVSRKGFHRGFRDDDHDRKKISRDKVFNKKSLRAGRPDIAPSRESFFASDRPVPEDRTPPPPVRNVKVKDLKQKRKLVKERERSVLRPETGRHELPVAHVSPREKGKPKNLQQPQLVDDERQRRTISDEAQKPEKKGGKKQLNTKGQEQPPPQTDKAVSKEEMRKRQSGKEPQQQPPPAGISHADGNGRKKSVVDREQPPVRQPVNGKREAVRPRAVTSPPPAPSPPPPPPAQEQVRNGKKRQAPIEERRPQPSTDDNRRKGKEKQPEAEQSPMPAPDDRFDNRERPMRVTPEERIAPPARDNGGNIGRQRRERSTEEEPRLAPPSQERENNGRDQRRQMRNDSPPQAPEFDGSAGNGRDRRKNGKGRLEEQADIPQCGPGQKDEFNPERCPQNR